MDARPTQPGLQARAELKANQSCNHSSFSGGARDQGCDAQMPAARGQRYTGHSSGMLTCQAEESCVQCSEPVGCQKNVLQPGNSQPQLSCSAVCTSVCKDNHLQVWSHVYAVEGRQLHARQVQDLTLLIHSVVLLHSKHELRRPDLSNRNCLLLQRSSSTSFFFTTSYLPQTRVLGDRCCFS